MSDQNDMYGYTPAQGSLFGSGEDRMQPPPQNTMSIPDMARERLNAVLVKARAAKTMPWSERDVRMWQIVFPNMAKWLPEDEANQLRFEFEREIERLKLAA